jgi:hypothetical protein
MHEKESVNGKAMTDLRFHASAVRDFPFSQNSPPFSGKLFRLFRDGREVGAYLHGGKHSFLQANGVWYPLTCSRNLVGQASHTLTDSSREIPFSLALPFWNIGSFNAVMTLDGTVFQAKREPSPITRQLFKKETWYHKRMSLRGAGTDLAYMFKTRFGMEAFLTLGGEDA